MKRFLPAILGIAAVILTGAVHGFWTGRWQLSSDAQAAGARLPDVSLVVGDWQGEDLPIHTSGDEPITGQLYRRYVNRRSGKAVRVFLVCGLPGPVSIHSPDACYGASGYKVTPLGKKTVPAGADGSAEFEAADMHKERVTDRERLRILWSWNTAGNWVVPRDTRLTFARYPHLYKLYLMRDLARAGESLEDDPCLDLMGQLGPELRRALFPGT
jgi:hypothetical protein